MCMASLSNALQQAFFLPKLTTPTVLLIGNGPALLILLLGMITVQNDLTAKLVYFLKVVNIIAKMQRVFLGGRGKRLQLFFKSEYKFLPKIYPRN